VPNAVSVTVIKLCALLLRLFHHIVFQCGP